MQRRVEQANGHRQSRHNVKKGSKICLLLGLQAGWRNEKLEAGVYVRNALNRQYAVRGFSFGNEPPDFAEKLYTQLGDPREGGITLRWRF